MTEQVTPPPAQTPPPQAVDVQAEIAKALAAQSADFANQFKAATGHENIKSFTDAQLLAQGKLQELADSKAKEAAQFKNKFESAAINNAILTSAHDAVDPSLIAKLLAFEAVCDEHGGVTIQGKPAAEAIKQLLIDKPFLAKAKGVTGSGAGQNLNSGVKTISRAGFDALEAHEKSSFLKTGGNVSD